MNRIKMKNEKVILSRTGRSNISRTKVWDVGVGPDLCIHFIMT